MQESIMDKSTAKKLCRLSAAAATVLLVPVSVIAQDARPAGFSHANASRQASLERQIMGFPDAARMLVYHRAMTAEPHHAGTPANEETAEYFAERLREFGFDSIIMNRYEVLLPRPIERDVRLLSPERYRLQLREPALDPDPDTRKGGVLPTFNAYSADGDATAEVVYVNYGIPEDYSVLDSLGISVEGKIVVARYGRSWRGIKPRLAAERGAVGALIYSDPEDDGFVQGPVMPDGRWRPEHGVQRGSVMDMPTYPGDPQTPGRPSKPGAVRIPLEETPTLQKIPVLPISYADAEPILRNLGGPMAPEAWRGGLPTTYRMGPGPATVRMRLRFDWSVRPIVNVIGILRGTDEPEKIVMAGGHRDAWTFGGRDPISGAVSLLETARSIAEAAKQGQRPKRSIAIASWDAEEYGLIGSTEYGEEFGDQLQGNLVVYLNRESYTAGPFNSSGVHSLQPLVSEVARLAPMPGDTQTVYGTWLRRQGDPGHVHMDGRTDVRLGALGSGSDYTVFVDHLGVPSLGFGFSSGNGIYHSRYDTHFFFTSYGDPEFVYGERLAELVALFIIRMANADILQFDYAATAETIDRYLDELREQLEKRNLRREIDLRPVRLANRRLGAAAVTLNSERDRLLSLAEGTLQANKDAIRQLNQLLLDAEQGFLHEPGLPGRSWYRHQLYAPGFYTGYGVKTLPGVREAIEKEDPEEANQMVEALVAALDRVRDVLVEGIVVAAGIK
jgi:N-acetylated-alpha-linked acidic dipeptidase